MCFRGVVPTGADQDPTHTPIPDLADSVDRGGFAGFALFVLDRGWLFVKVNSAEISRRGKSAMPLPYGLVAAALAARPGLRAGGPGLWAGLTAPNAPRTRTHQLAQFHHTAGLVRSAVARKLQNSGQPVKSRLVQNSANRSFTRSLVRHGQAELTARPPAAAAVSTPRSGLHALGQAHLTAGLVKSAVARRLQSSGQPVKSRLVQNSANRNFTRSVVHHALGEPTAGQGLRGLLGTPGVGRLLGTPGAGRLVAGRLLGLV
jgi:hypothetical protein